MIWFLREDTSYSSASPSSALCLDRLFLTVDFSWVTNIFSFDNINKVTFFQGVSPLKCSLDTSIMVGFNEIIFSLISILISLCDPFHINRLDYHLTGENRLALFVFSFKLVLLRDRSKKALIIVKNFISNHINKINMSQAKRKDIHDNCIKESKDHFGIVGILNHMLVENCIYQVEENLIEYPA